MTEATWRFGSLRPMKYGLILADPPWQYEMYGEAGYDKSPEAHYDTLSDDEIGSRSVRNLIESPRRAHSQKPPEMRVMADKLCPRAFGCELFAADPWPGHDTWGLPHRGPDAVPRAVPAPAEPVLAPMPLFEGS
ncbi:MAG: hypothetical protein B7Z41_04135 [Rhizobiales bacterium 12-66-7]|nr:MAG: hypothetical protein B7Z41_04135 [Rhizobiales bacterium 12-66-7]